MEKHKKSNTRPSEGNHALQSRLSKLSVTLNFANEFMMLLENDRSEIMEKVIIYEII